MSRASPDEETPLNAAPPRMALPTEIPVIDVAGHDDASAARLLRDACENSGFFYISGHGVPPSVVETAFVQAKRFFDLPLDERLTVIKDRFHRGYLPLGTTQRPGQKKDLKDSFDFGVELPLTDPDVICGMPLHGPNQWPDLPGFRGAMETYAAYVRTAALKLVRVLALSLDLNEDFFLQHYQKPVFTTRVIHYPVPDQRFEAEYDIGALAHTDYGHITVLAQDPSGGLEIRLPSGEWVSAPVIDGTFVVNLGDLMQRWSNDAYRSNYHRVVNRLGRDRLSIPTFVYPDFRTLICCIPTCVSADRPAKYEPVLAGDYVADMLRATQGFRSPASADA